MSDLISKQAAIEACRDVAAKWSFHSVAPSAAINCADAIEKLEPETQPAPTTIHERIRKVFNVDQPVRRFVLENGRICNWCRTQWSKPDEHPQNGCLALIGLGLEALSASSEHRPTCSSWRCGWEWRTENGAGVCRLPEDSEIHYVGSVDSHQFQALACNCQTSSEAK